MPKDDNAPLMYRLDKLVIARAARSAKRVSRKQLAEKRRLLMLERHTKRKANEQLPKTADVQAALEFVAAPVTKPGHRTMVDPVHAALEAVAAPATKQDWEKAVVAAEQKAADTAKMLARSGRASYTTADQQKQPDPGAFDVGGRAIKVEPVSWFDVLSDCQSFKKAPKRRRR